MKKLICIFFTAALFVSAGCKKSFFDINQNQNSPIDESITPKAILPSVLHRAAAKMATSYGNYGGWMGYWARSGTYGPNTEEESYNITTGFEADEWTWYDILFDANVMEKKAVAANQPIYQGIAKLIKAVGYMYLVDQYNNVPYSAAFDIKNLTPAYDKGSDIYKALLADLEVAAKLIADGQSDAALQAADIVFHGDKVKWQQLINTQRLKLLIHQSEVISPADVSSVVASITANGKGFLSGVGEYNTSADGSALVNPPYAQDKDKQNPFWDTYSQLYTGDIANQFWRASNFILNKFADHDDERYASFFAEAQTPLQGQVYYGFNYGEIIPNSDPFKAANSSDVSGPGITKSASQPQWFFTVTESLFLQAEATQRGWLPGSAQAVYEDAVRSSFTWLGADPANATLILDAGGYANFAAAPNKIKLIAEQKYLALTNVNNFEAYVDYRRLDGAQAILTDMPLSLSPSRGSNQVPLRILYPQTEYNYNAANVGKEGTINAQSSRIFWDKGPR